MNAADSAPPDHEGRVECVHGARCGGCALLQTPAVEQARQKRERVQDALRGYPMLAGVSVGKVAPAEPIVGYRTRAKLVVAPDGRIGLYARGSHDVVDIPHCRVISPVVAAVVADVRARLSHAPQAGLDALDVREVSDDAGQGALLTLIGDPARRDALVTFARTLLATAHVRAIAWSPREHDAPALLGAAPEPIAGPAASRDRVSADEPYTLVAHGSFTQAHRGQAAALARAVIEETERRLSGLHDKRVLELYAGSGALGLSLARRGAHVLLVERFAPALELGARAAAEQAIAGVETRAGDATRVLRELCAAGARFGAVIVNPPRAGLPAAVRAGLCELAPRAIAYVSCEPQTLARDLSHLATLGYRGTTLAPFDMLPLSAAVEAVAWLAAAPPPAPQVLYEDAALLVLDKPPHLPTTPQSGGKRSLLGWAQRAFGLPELAAVHRLDAGTSGICLFAKQRRAVAELSAALAAGEKQYLALARGITRQKGSIRRPLVEDHVQRDARTRYQRLAVLGGHSLLRVRPEHGRTHQIRRHLAGLGHPVLGDARYGDDKSNRHLEHKHGLDRTFLHLEKLTLPRPGAQSSQVLESPLCADLEAVRASLGDGLPHKAQ